MVGKSANLRALEMSSVWHKSSKAILVAVALFRRGEQTPISRGPRLEFVKYNPEEDETTNFHKWINNAGKHLDIPRRLEKFNISGTDEKEVWLFDAIRKTPIAITNQSAWEACRVEYIEKMPPVNYQLTSKYKK